LPAELCTCAELDAGPVDAARTPDAPAEFDAASIDAAPIADAPPDATNDAGTDAVIVQLEILPRSLDFGSPCSDTSHDFTIRNEGTLHSGPLTVDVLGDQFTLVGTDCLRGLAPGADCLAEVRATYSTPGSHEGSLRARSASHEANAPLTAAHLSCDAILWGGPPIELGSVAVGARSEPSSTTISSTVPGPTAPLRVVIVGSNPGDFEVVPVPDSCVGLVLSNGQRCEVTVRFSPTAPGPRSAVLRVGTAIVSLSGVGL
jgi:hypothetical protein